MDAILTALTRVDWLVGASVAVLVLGLVAVVALSKPYVIPIKTQQEQLDAERARADNAEAEAAARFEAARVELTERMTNFRSDHAARMEQAERFFDVALAEARRYADDWKATAHIEAENAKASEDRMDEVLETVRLVAGVVTSLQHAVTGQMPAQLPPGSRDG